MPMYLNLVVEHAYSESCMMTGQLCWEKIDLVKGSCHVDADVVDADVVDADVVDDDDDYDVNTSYLI